MKYISKRQFQLWTLTVSHSCLFLRSNKVEEDGICDIEGEDDKTIDIEFWDVNYMEIGNIFLGLEITKIYTPIPDRFLPFLVEDRSLFQISSNSQNFHVIAGGCKIGKSNMPYWEHRTLNLFQEYEEFVIL